jgi:hypothetical protein
MNITGNIKVSLAVNEVLAEGLETGTLTLAEILAYAFDNGTAAQQCDLDWSWSSTLAGTLTVPAAPTVSQVGTGGTVAAGTYYFVITYTNSYGETIGSAQSTVTTTGATSTITVTSPAVLTGATGWKAYGGTNNGGPYFAQGGTNSIGSNLVLTTTPTGSGANPPTSNSSGAADTWTLSALTDGLGRSVPFRRIRIFYLSNPNTVDGNILTVGGAASNEWTAIVGGAGQTFPVKSLGVEVKTALNTTGFVVTPSSSDQLKIKNAGPNPITYRIALVGASV